jgi:outer membrane protein assembly factor BamB
MPDGTGRDIRALATRGDWLVVTSLTGPIRAYDVRSRRQRWEYVDSPADAVALRVRVHGDQIYVPYSDGSLVALDLETGAERWRTGDGTQSFDWPPAASATSIFATAADRLLAFDLPPLETAPRREHDHR